MGKEIRIKWLPEPEEKDFLAAESYLALIHECKDVGKIVARLRKAPIVLLGSDQANPYGLTRPARSAQSNVQEARPVGMELDIGVMVRKAAFVK